MAKVQSVAVYSAVIDDEQIGDKDGDNTKVGSDTGKTETEDGAASGPNGSAS